MKIVSIFLLILLMFSISCRRDEQEKFGYGKLNGKITNKYGQGVAQAIVWLDAPDNFVFSNEWGYYSFDKVIAKEHMVSAGKDKYLTKVSSAKIQKNSTLVLDFILETGSPSLEISDSFINADQIPGTIDFTITSNTGWFIRNNSSWLTCSKTLGEGNDHISIYLSGNEGDTRRIDTLQIVSGDIIRYLVVLQDIPFKILNTEGIVGNLMKSVDDSVYVLFNKPVTVNTIAPVNAFCQCALKFNQDSKGLSVKFSYACASIGGDYPFTISVTDRNKVVTSRTFSVPFYRSKIKIKGFITDILLVNDEKEVLVSTYWPETIVWYSIKMDTVLRVFDMSGIMTPRKLTYNPYNGKIYITGGTPHWDGFTGLFSSSDLNTLDLETGKIAKSLTIVRDASMDYWNPQVSPIDLGFTTSGLGIVLLSGTHAEYIDCRKKDTIIPIPANNCADFPSLEYVVAVPNYNMSKLILMQNYGSCIYGIFDGYTGKITSLTPTSRTRSVFIAPSRINKNIYLGQLYDQFVIDPEGNMSRRTEFDNRNNASSDFIYRPGGDKTIFLCDDSYLSIMNYETATTPMYQDVVYGLRNFTATVDGKYAIAYQLGHNDISSILYTFNADSFFRNAK